MKTAREIWTKANAIRNRLIAEFPEHAEQLRGILIKISPRMTACAGKAQYPSTIKLSAPFFESDVNFDNDLENTVTHEIAHIIAGHGEGHGPRWRSLHTQFGGNGKRCHQLELAEGYERRKRKPKVEVLCPKCNEPMLLGPTQYKKHKRGYIYSHTKCPA